MKTSRKRLLDLYDAAGRIQAIARESGLDSLRNFPSDARQAEAALANARGWFLAVGDIAESIMAKIDTWID